MNLKKTSGRIFYCCLVAKLCLTLLSPHGLWPTRLLFPWYFQARIWKWVAICFLGDRPNPGIKTTSPVSTALAGPFFTTEPPGSLRVQYSYQMMNDGEQKISQFSLVAQSCPTLCDPMNCSTPGLPVHHPLPESTQTHFH